MNEKLEQFLVSIGEQIRWKRARPILLREFSDHAQAQFDDCLDSGLSEEEAAEETLRQLGDPVEIGQELDRLHRPRPQWFLLLLTGLLALAGTILPLLLLNEQSSFPVDPVKSICFALLGFGALAAGYFLNYMQLIRHSNLITFLTLAAMVLLLVFSPKVNAVAYYAQYVSLVYPVVFALTLCSTRGLGWLGVAQAVFTLLLMLQTTFLVPRMKDALVLALSGGVLLLLAAWQDWFQVGRKKGVICLSAVLLAGAALPLFLVPEQLCRRLDLVLHPEADPLGRGYMALTIRSIISGSKAWGTGELSGFSLWLMLPQSGDDAFAVTAIHFLGRVPVALFCGALSALLIWSFLKVLRQTNTSARLLCLSVLFILCGNAFFSFLLMFGYVFFGASFPFLRMNLESVIQMGLMGLLLSVFRQETLPYSSFTQTGGKWSRFFSPYEV